jgi:hypothetical protein
MHLCQGRWGRSVFFIDFESKGSKKKEKAFPCSCRPESLTHFVFSLFFAGEPNKALAMAITQSACSKVKYSVLRVPALQ